ncbi:hypothetical protein Q7O_001668 [Pectobacterium carotovorum subsp. carotovorum PCCS1]|nr:hypothetical protein [Pectobacterium carotovorum subsp. carotovorum PCCS1]
MIKKWKLFLILIFLVLRLILSAKKYTYWFADLAVVDE